MDKANDYLREEFNWYISNECFVNSLRWEVKRGAFSSAKFKEYKQDIIDECEDFKKKVDVLKDAGFLSKEDAAAWKSSANRARREMIHDMLDVLGEVKK